ncbi:hypothetical protein JOH51_001457 [Rhizobium leguminosarum]|nr:hypothetical protein [Rhizobium leguminosarum]MBP2444018.1 hypothetical protein [Rhizobium leguminosarum]
MTISPTRLGDLVLQADEAHAEMVEFFERRQEMAGRAGEAVELPDQDTIEFAVAGAGHQGVVLGGALLGGNDGGQIFVSPKGSIPRFA